MSSIDMPPKITDDTEASGADVVTEFVDGDASDRESKLERLKQELGSAYDMGKRAVMSVVRLAPLAAEKVKDAYQSETGQKIVGVAKAVAVEAAKGGARAVGDYYGVGYENGRVSVESKRRLALSAARLMEMPQKEAVSLLKVAGRGAVSGVSRRAA